MRTVLIDGDTKQCSGCHIIKHKEEFHKDKKGPLGRTYYCKKCANEKGRVWHNANKHKESTIISRRNRYLKFTYGITLEHYEELLRQQGGRCAICAVKLQSGGHSHVDHCHNKGEVRAILCTNCNRGLGHFQENPEFLERAATYIRKHRQSVDLPEEEVVDEA